MVDNLWEAAAVRAAAPTAEVLVWQPWSFLHLRDIGTERLHFVVGEFSEIELIEKALALHTPSPTVSIHLLIDLGIGDRGFPPDLVAAAAQRVLRIPGATLVGVAGHLTVQYGWERERCLAEARAFAGVLKQLEQQGHAIRWFHLEHSGSIGQDLDRDHLTLVRAGSAIYGYDPAGRPTVQQQLRPVLSLWGRILVCRTAKAEPAVGYYPGSRLSAGQTYAVIGVGYSVGLPEAWWQHAGTIVDGRFWPLLGRPAMNTALASLPGLPPTV
jgi:alanine racemase